MKKETEHYYNVVAYSGKDRVMKETLTARNRAQAADIGRAVLTARGFKLADVSIEVVPLDRRRMERLLSRGASAPSPRLRPRP
jgi:hypothetical protein